MFLDTFIVMKERNLILCNTFADPSLNVLASGPYALIFASFVPFYLDIPVSTRFRVFNIQFSDKAFIYVAGLQVSIQNDCFYFLLIVQGVK